MAFYSYINNKQFYHILAKRPLLHPKKSQFLSGTKKGKHDAVCQEISVVLPLPSSCCHVVRAVNDTENPMLISCTGHITTTSNEEQTVSKKNTATQSLLMENLLKPHKCCCNNDEAMAIPQLTKILNSTSLDKNFSTA